MASNYDYFVFFFYVLVQECLRTAKTMKQPTVNLVRKNERNLFVVENIRTERDNENIRH